MMDYGFVYKGHERFITAWPWNYGQVRLSQKVGLGWVSLSWFLINSISSQRATNKSQGVWRCGDFPSSKRGMEGRGDAFQGFCFCFKFFK